MTHTNTCAIMQTHSEGKVSQMTRFSTTCSLSSTALRTSGAAKIERKGMGINLCEVSFSELWTLVLKRLVYLVAKFISFKGAAFIVCCAFLYIGVISGAVWCSLILGIITNRTGKQIMNHLGKGEYEDEKKDDGFASDSVRSPSPALCKSARNKGAGKPARTAAGAKEKIRNILSNGEF